MIDDEIIQDAPVLIEQDAIKSFVGVGYLFNVISKDLFKKSNLIAAIKIKDCHMGDIKNASTFSHSMMLFN